MILFEILLGGAALLVLLPATVLFAEAVLAVTIRGNPAVPLPEIQEGDRSRLAVVIPAHNEASVISSTLRSVVPQLGKADRLTVVADNCSDETAAIAATEGAEVITRRDLVRRGKGYALDHRCRLSGCRGLDRSTGSSLCPNLATGSSAFI
jgi:cellulose synthase/poly-beta-1,6-N-acetylglucosamine synthase-like glycosyltransferase